LRDSIEQIPSILEQKEMFYVEVKKQETEFDLKLDAATKSVEDSLAIENPNYQIETLIVRAQI